MPYLKPEIDFESLHFGSSMSNLWGLLGLVTRKGVTCFDGSVSSGSLFWPPKNHPVRLYILAVVLGHFLTAETGGTWKLLTLITQF